MRNNIFGTLAILLFGCTGLMSQPTSTSPYNIDWRKDAPTLAAGAGLSLVSYLAEQKVTPRSEPDLANLTNKDWLGIDRSATNNYSPNAADASDWLLRSSVLLPFSLLVDADMRQDANKVGVLLSETVLLTYGLTNMTKIVTLRDRPYVFNPDAPLETKLENDARLSFFSGHTSMTASLSFFTAKVWSDYHPNHRLQPVVWTAAATLPAVTGYLRYKSGKHYLTDVGAGYVVGALVGYLVPHLHKVERGERRKFRMSTSMVDDVPVFRVKYRF